MGAFRDSVGAVPRPLGEGFAAARHDEIGASPVALIAYYLAFCVFCCVCLLGLVQRDKRGSDVVGVTDRPNGDGDGS